MAKEINSNSGMVQVFNNGEFGSIRMLEIDGEPWFVGKDLALALGYGDTDQAMRKHVDDEDKQTRRIDGSGQNRKMYIINESGFFSLVVESDLPNAKKFKHWVTSEVLPSIRKTGSYSSKPMSQLEVMAGTIQEMIRIDNQCKALQSISDDHGQQLEAHEHQIEAVNNKVVQISDAIAAREVKNSWRKDTAAKINQIARSEGCSGDFKEDIKVVRHAIYEAVDRRCGVRLYVRLNNRKDRMAENGVPKTKIEKRNIVDEIAEKPKYIQAYTDVISDFLIAFPWPDKELDEEPKESVIID